MIAKDKKHLTLMQKRKRAILLSLAAIVLLAVTLFFVMRYVGKSTPVVDVDGTTYYLRNRYGTYVLYDAEGEEVYREKQFGYYVTEAGTLIELDAETGEYEFIVLDTEDSETVGIHTRLLIFPTAEEENIMSIEVHNGEGSFVFGRRNVATGEYDADFPFVIEEAPFAPYDQELFAQLYTDAGYTISTEKIQDPIKNGDGDFTEYGLVPEVRLDDEGNPYDYEPAYYILTTTDGVRHKLLIGDRLVTGGGYYVQYVKLAGDMEKPRDAVYVLSAEIARSLLVPVETFATAKIVEGVTNENYALPENFIISEQDPSDPTKMKETVAFTAIPLSERKGTRFESEPYRFIGGEVSGYEPHVNNISAALQTLISPSFVGVTHVAPTAEELIACKLAVPKTGPNGEQSCELQARYSISFIVDVTDDESGETVSTLQSVLISEKNENGNYYAYSMVYEYNRSTKHIGDVYVIYDTVVEIYPHGMPFVERDTEYWINRNLITSAMAFAESIKIKTSDYEATFLLDNDNEKAKEDPSNAELICIYGTDSEGNELRTMPLYTVVDTAGIHWQITERAIRIFDANGKEGSIREGSSYYAENKLGYRVKVLSGYISGDDGSKIYVSADYITVKAADGSETRYVRFATDLFRLYYQTLLNSTIEGSYAMTPEEESALLADEQKKLATLTVTFTDGTQREICFYQKTSRKSYITINGQGGFYVLPDRVNKIVSDAQRFFALEIIEPNAKH